MVLLPQHIGLKISTGLLVHFPWWAKMMGMFLLRGNYPWHYDAPHHGNYVTTGGMVFAGNLAVTEVDAQGYPQQSSPHYYWGSL